MDAFSVTLGDFAELNIPEVDIPDINEVDGTVSIVLSELNGLLVSENFGKPPPVVAEMVLLFGEVSLPSLPSFETFGEDTEALDELGATCFTIWTLNVGVVTTGGEIVLILSDPESAPPKMEDVLDDEIAVKLDLLEALSVELVAPDVNELADVGNLNVNNPLVAETADDDVEGLKENIVVLPPEPTNCASDVEVALWGAAAAKLAQVNWGREVLVSDLLAEEEETSVNGPIESKELDAPADVEDIVGLNENVTGFDDELTILNGGAT